MTGIIPFQPATPAIGGKTFDTGVVGGAQRPDELKYNGGVFQFIKGGNIISQVNGEVQVIILGATPAVASRVYYKPPYDPNNTAPPECWSTDGNTPDAAAPGPGDVAMRPASCAGCPKNIEGSGGSPGTKACSYSRYLVVTHPPVEGHPPHAWLMRLNGGTLFGTTNNEAQNWFSFVGTKRAGGLIKFLDANGYAGRHHQILTTIKPDLQPGANNKLQFSPTGLIDANTLPLIENYIEGNLDRIRDLTALSFTPRETQPAAAGGAGQVSAAPPPADQGLGATSPLQNAGPQAGPQMQPAQQMQPGQVMQAGNTATFAGPGAPPAAQPAGPGTQQTDPHAVDAQLGQIISGMQPPQS